MSSAIGDLKQSVIAGGGIKGVKREDLKPKKKAYKSRKTQEQRGKKKFLQGIWEELTSQYTLQGKRGRGGP